MNLFDPLQMLTTVLEETLWNICTATWNTLALEYELWSKLRMLLHVKYC